MTCFVRIAFLATLVFPGGCAVASAPTPGDEPSTGGGDEVFSRTTIRTLADGTRTTEVTWVTKAQQISERDGVEQAAVRGAPGSGVAARTEALTYSCAGLEVWDGFYRTGNTICFLGEPGITDAVDLTTQMRWSSCRRFPPVCYRGYWGGAVRSFRTGRQYVSFKGTLCGPNETGFAPYVAVDVADAFVQHSGTIKFVDALPFDGCSGGPGGLAPAPTALPRPDPEPSPW